MNRLLACALLAGCAAGRPSAGVLAVRGNLAIFQDVAAPLDYRSDVGHGQREVRGEACQKGFVLPVFALAAAFGAASTGGRLVKGVGTASVSWGEGGYRQALKAAQAQAPGAQLVDVRADLHVTNILFVWRKACVAVVATAQ